jgi:hypothetical protein
MNFVFIDETGDPGSDVEKGASAYFGMALICVKDIDYEAISLLLSQVHWLCGTAKSISLGHKPVRAFNLLRGLHELAGNGLISASGLYIDKEKYGGRYLTWTDLNVSPNEWRYYLRNYLLRHLLEFHFHENGSIQEEPLDLVIDRVMLSQSQHDNIFKYLNGRPDIPLKRPFGIPPISFVTISDSKYTGGLEVAHLLADVLRDQAKGTLATDIKLESGFLKISQFVGHRKPE